MRRERQAILSLIALGRITPREAEHLLAAWDAGREEIWIILLCALTGMAQALPAAARIARSFFTMHHALAAIAEWIGGVL